MTDGSGGVFGIKCRIDESRCSPSYEDIFGYVGEVGGRTPPDAGRYQARARLISRLASHVEIDRCFAPENADMGPDMDDAELSPYFESIMISFLPGAIRRTTGHQTNTQSYPPARWLLCRAARRSR